MLQSPLFYCKNKDTYPPFKNGLYLEEYFLHKLAEGMMSPGLRPSNIRRDVSGQSTDASTPADTISAVRTYIPVLWTNFQIEGWFQHQKPFMQKELDKWIQEHPNPNGYFTVVQYDDGPLLQLPPNTIVFGACSGDIPIPLIYEDKNRTLQLLAENRAAASAFSEKSILCSFVGNITANNVLPNVRAEIFNRFSQNPRFVTINSGGWTPDVRPQLQDIFIETTINSKFAFAPRGYGRSSFRFFECFLLRTIPIYIWNDANWLPFQDQINYSKLCIVLHISELASLEGILLSIDENQYNKMWEYYETIKHFFELEGMSTEILRLVREKST
jgi:hypothetical protein